MRLFRRRKAENKPVQENKITVTHGWCAEWEGPQEAWLFQGPLDWRVVVERLGSDYHGFGTFPTGWSGVDFYTDHQEAVKACIARIQINIEKYPDNTLREGAVSSMEARIKERRDALARLEEMLNDPPTT